MRTTILFPTGSVRVGYAYDNTHMVFVQNWRGKKKSETRHGPHLLARKPRGFSSFSFQLAPVVDDMFLRMRARLDELHPLGLVLVC